MELSFRLDDLRGAEVQELLKAHLADLEPLSPPESRHALDLDGLRAPDVTFWSVWGEAALVGFGALKELDRHHGEIKSMHTAKASVAGHRRAHARTRHGRGPAAAVSAPQPGDGLDGSLCARPRLVRKVRLRHLLAIRRLSPRPEQCVHDLRALDFPPDEVPHTLGQPGSFFEGGSKSMTWSHHLKNAGAASALACLLDHSPRQSLA